MAKTLLQLVQAATSELGLNQPTVVARSSDSSALQYFGLLNAVGRSLQEGFDWQNLCTEYRFSTQFLIVTGTITLNSTLVTDLVSATGSTTGLDSTYMVTGTGIPQDTYVSTSTDASGATVNWPSLLLQSGGNLLLQSSTTLPTITLSQAAQDSGSVTLSFCKTKYTMPADYSRPIDQTQWDKTRHWSLLGPQTAQQWQFLKSGYISNGPRMKFRPLGGYFQTWPPMATAEYLGMEYVSSNWSFDKNGVAQAAFATDQDTCIFPDNLMITGLKDRWTQAKGLARTYLDEYENALSLAKANDVGSDSLSLRGSRDASILLGINNLPDTGFGS